MDEINYRLDRLGSDKKEIQLEMMKRQEANLSQSLMNLVENIRTWNHIEP